MPTIRDMRHAIRVLRDGDWPTAILGAAPCGWRLGGDNYPLCEHFARELERSLEAEDAQVDVFERLES